jgi:hypothetical protein
LWSTPAQLDVQNQASKKSGQNINKRTFILKSRECELELYAVCTGAQTAGAVPPGTVQHQEQLRVRESLVERRKKEGEQQGVGGCSRHVGTQESLATPVPALLSWRCRGERADQTTAAGQAYQAP